MNTEQQTADKPLGRKAYGSIGHLPGSRLGPGDHHVHEGQAAICTENAGGRQVYVQEKLDGSCVAVARIGDDIVPLIRAGYRASDSHREFHHHFHDWAMANEVRFLDLLDDDERVVGEWLGLAHGTRYLIASHEDPFVPFDLMRDDQRAGVEEVRSRCDEHEFTTPWLVAEQPIPPEKAMDALGRFGAHRASPSDGPEGVVYRVESTTKRGGLRVDFLAKWVRPDKVDGKYLVGTAGYIGDGDDVWNWRP